MQLITMQDGTAVQFSDKVQVHRSPRITEDGKIIVDLAFRDGTRSSIILEQSSPAFKDAAQAGLLGKITQTVAGEEDVETLKASCADLAQAIQAGNFSAARSAGGTSGMSELGKALISVTGKSAPEIKVILEGLTLEQKHALRRTPAIAAALAAQKAAEQPSEVEAAALSKLGELGITL